MSGGKRVFLPAAAAVLAIVLAAAGCSAQRTGSSDVSPEWSLPETASLGQSESIPPADLSVPLVDEAGREPADAFADHIAAVATGDPQKVWATYGGEPPADYATWAAEWEDAAEVYESSAVLEQRVVEDDLALVRVVYRVRSGDDLVEVTAPGEWWRIVKVDGRWKVGWLPRQ